MQTFEQQFPVASYDPDMPITPVPWLVEGLWQKGKINGVAGYEKSGKSRLLGWLLVGMYSRNVVGLNIVPNYPPKILYLCGEETKEVVNQRLAKYAKLQSVDDTRFRVDFMDAAAMRLDLKPQRESLLQYLLDNDYEMIVMDPMRRLHAANEDKSTDMAPIYNDIRKWSNRHGLTVVLVHHTGKIGEETDMERIASWFRGSTDLAAILDTAMYVQRLTKGSVRVMRQGRYEPLPPFVVNDHSDGAGFTRSK